MSKKCIKCGHTLPDDASFCPHCTAVQTEKQEIKTPRRWKRATLDSSGNIDFHSNHGGDDFHVPQTEEYMKVAHRLIMWTRIKLIKFC